MIRVMSKEEALQDLLEQHVFDRWQFDLPEIDERYRQEKEQIERRFLAAFEAVCKQAAKLQAEGRKGSIRYVYISFLRTSIMANTAHYRIDAYDDNWFLDLEECASSWSADFIFAPLFRRMGELEEKRKAYARKITRMDIEKIKLIEAYKYHLLTVEWLRGFIPSLIESEAYRRMDKSVNLQLFIGEYKDQCELLYETSGGDDERCRSN
ncbi:hypothetical protein ABD76_10740 [Paenibacillus dendritiformis]|uniref:hypothetical protein n=1 Tax=Paenibacillus dendritiformis TaxID=130049 RepID=UPI0018CCA07D|nr:hypothetical protein [Paenibacillus dendritiformis]MBG9792938.1 hypothetical protein [Paenibacillus dendritiformis]